MFVRVKNGKIECYNDNCALNRVYEIGVVDAFLSNDEKRILATYKDGKVKIINTASGITERFLESNNAVRAIFQGDNILVTLKNGNIEIRNKEGILIRLLS